jgi:Lrp/AsnC family leucine-responsive transcriptional regulator
MSPIDTLDEQILDALQDNGRLTMKALAERVGLSSPAMIERVRRLEERGVIAGYRAIIQPASIGRPLTALIVATVDRQDHDAFLTAISAEPSIVECHRTTGAAGFLIKAHVADTLALEALVDELGATGATCETSLVLSSPVPYRPMTAPEGTAAPRTRLSRRRRRAATGENRPGRPRAAAAVAESATEAPPSGRRRGRPANRRRPAGDES